MAFVAAFVAHAPDADPGKHRCVIETPKYKLHVIVVQNQEQAKEVCGKLAAEEGVTSIVLCPGFNNRDVAEIAEVVGPGVGVNVARGDGPSTRIAVETIAREWA
jgi:hypothetical protein